MDLWLAKVRRVPKNDQCNAGLDINRKTFQPWSREPRLSSSEIPLALGNACLTSRHRLKALRGPFHESEVCRPSEAAAPPARMDFAICTRDVLFRRSLNGGIATQCRKGLQSQD